jgi:hypothetical protein
MDGPDKVSGSGGVLAATVRRIKSFFTSMHIRPATGNQKAAAAGSAPAVTDQSIQLNQFSSQSRTGARIGDGANAAVAMVDHTALIEGQCYPDEEAVGELIDAGKYDEAATYVMETVFRESPERPERSKYIEAFAQMDVRTLFRDEKKQTCLERLIDHSPEFVTFLADNPDVEQALKRGNPELTSKLDATVGKAVFQIAETKARESAKPGLQNMIDVHWSPLGANRTAKTAILQTVQRAATGDSMAYEALKALAQQGSKYHSLIASTLGSAIGGAKWTQGVGGNAVALSKNAMEIFLKLNDDHVLEDADKNHVLAKLGNGELPNGKTISSTGALSNQAAPMREALRLLSSEQSQTFSQIIFARITSMEPNRGDPISSAYNKINEAFERGGLEDATQRCMDDSSSTPASQPAVTEPVISTEARREVDEAIPDQPEIDSTPTEVPADVVTDMADLTMSDVSEPETASAREMPTATVEPEISTVVDEGMDVMPEIPTEDEMPEDFPQPSDFSSTFFHRDSVTGSAPKFPGMGNDFESEISDDDLPPPESNKPEISTQ